MSHAQIASAFAGLAFVVCGWVASFKILGYGPGMSPKLSVAAAAGVGAMLPFIPDLVKLLSLPEAVSNALCAVVVAVAYALVPKKAAEQ